MKKCRFFFLHQFWNICIKTSLYYHLQKLQCKLSVFGTSGYQRNLKFSWGGWKGGFECSGPFYLKMWVGVARMVQSILYSYWSNCLYLICISMTLKSLKLSSKWVVAELSSSIFEGDMKNNVWLSELNGRKKNTSWKCWKRSCYRNKCLKLVKFNAIAKFFFPDLKKW